MECRQDCLPGQTARVYFTTYQYFTTYENGLSRSASVYRRTKTRAYQFLSL